MLSDKQSQKAGDNSNQLQAETVNVYNTTNVLGITEERAREIVDEKIKSVIQEYSFEAHEIALKRIEEFSSVLIPKLVKNQLLDSLKDPSIQLLLLETEKSATATGKKDDYELLSELLVHRVKKGNDRNVLAGVNRAIRIVDEISDEALQGLTVAHSVEVFLPVKAKISDGLGLLNNLFSKVIYDELPYGMAWLEHLDILDAVRIDAFSRPNRIEQFYADKMSGYVDLGIRKDSEEHKKAIEILRSVQLPMDYLIDHELREDYVRLKLISRHHMDIMELQATTKINLLSDLQKDALNQIYDLYDMNAQLKNENVTKFANMFNSFENLKKVGEWWASINSSFTITSVGKVLAHANAQKCDPNLPPLYLKPWCLSQ